MIHSSDSVQFYICKSWKILVHSIELVRPKQSSCSVRKFDSKCSLSLSNVALEIVIYSSESVWLIKCSVGKFG